MRDPAGRSGFRASAPLLWPLLLGLRAMDLDVEALLARVGLSLRELEDPDTRMPIEVATELSFLAAEARGDEAMGLHLAEMYVPGAFGVLDYLAHSSRTLGEALRHLCRYNRLLQDAIETVLDVSEGQAFIWQRRLGGFRPLAGITENAIANLVIIGRQLSGAPVIPIEVQFTHAEPPNSAEHARIFKAPVRFEAERDGVILPAADLDLPLPNADPGLCAILDRHAKQLLDQLPRVARFSQRVRELVAAELKDGAPRADSVARKLHISQRTLHRRLKEDQTSYEHLVDGLRRALAERYLNEPKMSTDEVSLMLGYSEVSAFRRAFVRWFGVSPSRYRRRGKL
jgi:AraC-like DNA-binding protein